MIKHTIVSVEKIDDHTVRLKSEIIMDEVINGYGGGVITYEAPIELAAQVAKEKVEWKLTSVTNPMVWTPVLQENFDVLEDYLASLLPEPTVVDPEVPPVEEPVVEPVVDGSSVEPAHEGA